MPNAEHYLVDGVDHNVPAFLKKSGRLPNVIDCVFSGAGSVRDMLGPQCRLKSEPPLDRSFFPVDGKIAKPQLTEAERKLKRDAKQEKLGAMTQDELDWREEKRAKKKAERSNEG